MSLIPASMSRHLSGLKHWFEHKSSVTQTPLLDENELISQAHYAQSLPYSLFQFKHHTANPLLGEIPSSFRGRGYEFDDNRLYQAGDEQRTINWRLYARMGELYSRVFTEEHRPQVYLVIDRRANMRFATRKQLKARLAAKIAACYFYQAQQQGLSVGGLFLDEGLHLHSPGAGQATTDSFLQALIAPCPPFSHEQGDELNDISMLDALRDLIQRAQAGSFILLVSDFLDVAPEQAAPILNQLVAAHTVQAIQVLDPVEQVLPDDGDYYIANGSDAEPIRVNAGDNLQHDHYQQQVKDRQSRLSHCFEQNGVPFKSCTTLDEPDHCLAMPYGQ